MSSPYKLTRATWRALKQTQTDVSPAAANRFAVASDLTSVTKANCATASTGNLALTGEQTIDGVLTAASRVLCKDQTDASENGIWLTAAGAWTRATDFDRNNEVNTGVVVAIDTGATANGGKFFQLTTSEPINVGATDLAWLEVTAGDLAKLTVLSSNANGNGAALIGIEDVGAYYTGTDVEAALAELDAQLGGATSATFNFTEANVCVDDEAVYASLEKLDLKWGDLASTANGEGAALVAIEDPGAKITATDVEAALIELVDAMLKADGSVALAGDMTLADGVDLAVNTANGTKIGTAATQKLGFWGATPVIQHTATGDVTGFVAGSGAHANVDSVYTGASGATAYTMGDIVTALKAAGFLAA